MIAQNNFCSPTIWHLHLYDMLSIIKHLCFWNSFSFSDFWLDKIYMFWTQFASVQKILRCNEKRGAYFDSRLLKYLQQCWKKLKTSKLKFTIWTQTLYLHDILKIQSSARDRQKQVRATHAHTHTHKFIPLFLIY